MVPLSTISIFFLALIYFSVLASYQFGNPNGFNWARLNLSPTSPTSRFISSLLYGFYKVVVLAGILKTLTFLQHTLPALIFTNLYSIDLHHYPRARYYEGLQFFSTYGLTLLICFLFISIVVWNSTHKYLNKSSRLFIILELNCLLSSLVILSCPFTDAFLFKDLITNYESFFSLIILWLCSYTFSLMSVAYLKRSFEAILFASVTQILILMIISDHSMTIIKSQLIGILVIIFCINTSYQLFTAPKSQSRLSTTLKSLKFFMKCVLALLLIVLFLRIKVNFMNLEKEPYHYSYDQTENSLYVHQIRKTDQYYLFPALERPIQTVSKLAYFSHKVEPKFNQEDYIFRYEENPSVFKNGLNIKIYKNKKLLDTFYLDRLSNPSNHGQYQEYFRVSKNQISYRVIAIDPIHGSLFLKTTLGKYYQYVVGSQKLELIDGVITPIGANETSGIQNLKIQPYFIFSKNGKYDLRSSQKVLKISSNTVSKLRSFNNKDQTFYFNNCIYSYRVQYFEPHYKIRSGETEVTLTKLALDTKKVTVKKVTFGKEKRFTKPKFSKGNLYFTISKAYSDEVKETMYYDEINASKSFNSESINTISSLDFNGNVNSLLTLKKTKGWQYRNTEKYYHLNAYHLSVSRPSKPKQSIESINLIQSVPRLEKTILSPMITKVDNHYYSPLVPSNDSIKAEAVLPSGEILFHSTSNPWNANSIHFYTFNPQSNTIKLYKTNAQWSRFPIFEDRNGKIFTVPSVFNKTVRPSYARQVKLQNKIKERSHEN